MMINIMISWKNNSKKYRIDYTGMLFAVCKYDGCGAICFPNDRFDRSI